MSVAVIEQRERWERRDRAAEVARSLVESRVLVEFPSYRHGRPIRLIVRAGDGGNKQFAQFIQIGAARRHRHGSAYREVLGRTAPSLPGRRGAAAGGGSQDGRPIRGVSLTHNPIHEGSCRPGRGSPG